MERGLPDDHTVETALALAGRAPSVHNMQPWRWRVGDRSVHLYLDSSCVLPATDPDRRDIVLSCGAALHHLAVAFTALGWAAVVNRLPNPDDPDHLASMTLVPHRPTEQDVALSRAIPRRRTDRRHFTSWPIPPGHLSLFSERAGSLGAVVRVVDAGERRHIVAAAKEAARLHSEDESYRFELAMWTGRHAGTDGVPAHSTPAPRPGDELPARVFAGAELADPAVEADHAELLMIGTSGDDRLSRLRAGEAISAILLTATNIGLATCLVTEPLEIPAQRTALRVEVLHDTAYPQAFLRVGWAPTSAHPLPMTPRRPVAELLLPSNPD
ncbi:NAD(P)H nitroreductase [Nocardia higoensis]|uniref:NAD(P)H nitroreductase n=1 Tax=Nocardia higoensis TaxID=228599 RepID=A0ABS0DA27_9NOCA|nr:NAD(P)H nitroreductase [Nocardia higoensis]MBF6353729.1 NAD(P)H nitroreductase [Nocardia higoensis]